MSRHPAPSTNDLSWLGSVLGGTVAAVAPLAGGVAQAVDLVTRADGRRFVLRRWSRPGWRETDPGFGPENEVVALTALAGTGLPVPEVIAVDPDGRHCTHPALLMTWLPGTLLSSATHEAVDAEPLTADMLRQFVEAAGTLHSLDGTGLTPFAPYTDPALVLRPPRRSARPALWERCFEAVAVAPPVTPQVFIHRDYHPGNTLWLRGRLTGIVDWANASRGPAGQDFGHLRVNLLLAYGQSMADAVLPMIEGYDPYWDLVAFVDMYDDEDDPGPLDVLETYLDSVLHS